MNRKLRLRIIEQFDTQADFAQEIGGDESLVSRVVRGRRTLPEDKQVRWAEILKCDRGDIF